jgi:hypothetical protein
MVTPRMLGSRRGTSTLGCLTSVLVLVAIVYYGVNLGEVWWRYWNLKDRMNTAARFAQTQTVDQINRQLQDDVTELALPPEARKFAIKKTESPPSITISTRYRERVELPFLHRDITFHPVVTHKL